MRSSDRQSDGNGGSSIPGRGKREGLKEMYLGYLGSWEGAIVAGAEAAVWGAGDGRVMGGQGAEQEGAALGGAVRIFTRYSGTGMEEISLEFRDGC